MVVLEYRPSYMQYLRVWIRGPRYNAVHPRKFLLSAGDANIVRGFVFFFFYINTCIRLRPW